MAIALSFGHQMIFPRLTRKNADFYAIKVRPWLILYNNQNRGLSPVLVTSNLKGVEIFEFSILWSHSFLFFYNVIKELWTLMPQLQLHSCCILPEPSLLTMLSACLGRQRFEPSKTIWSSMRKWPHLQKRIPGVLFLFLACSHIAMRGQSIFYQATRHLRGGSHGSIPLCIKILATTAWSCCGLLLQQCFCFQPGVRQLHETNRGPSRAKPH